MSIPLTITAKQSGSTYITLTNTLQQRKSKINVTVPAEWDDVEVVIPETIGEQGYESKPYENHKPQFLSVIRLDRQLLYACRIQNGKIRKDRKNKLGRIRFLYDKNGNILINHSCMQVHWQWKII